MSTEARIDSLLGKTVSVDDKLAEVARDLAELHDRLARIVGSDVSYWTPRLPIEVTRSIFDSVNGRVTHYRKPEYATDFDTKHVHDSVTLYCYDVAPTPAPEPIDHDLTAENAPGESANTSDIGNHYFWEVMGRTFWSRIIVAHPIPQVVVVTDN